MRAQFLSILRMVLTAVLSSLLVRQPQLTDTRPFACIILLVDFLESWGVLAQFSNM